jgi:hypothetical protein
MKRCFLWQRKAMVGSFKARIRTTIMRKGMPKLAMKSFVVYVIPSVHGA